MKIDKERIGLRTVMKKINGDSLTPILIFRRLRGEQKFLLESNAKHEDSGRYSLIGMNPLKSFIGRKGQVEEYVYQSKKSYWHEGNIFSILKRLMPRIAFQCDYPFIGGAVGYVSYGAGRNRQQEEKGAQLPEFHLNVYETIIVFDHLKLEVILFKTEIDIEEKTVNFAPLIDEILNGNIEENEDFVFDDFKSSMTQEAFEGIVERGKDLIQAGELEQIVLSRRFEANFSGNPLSIYRILRKNNPSPYMYYMEIGQSVIIGASPESLVKVTDRLMMTNPIAGTRKRTTNEQENRRLANELKNDEKELMEHDMLVELSKKETAKVCLPETVQVTTYQELVFYEHVMHLVSEVEGQLAPGQHPLDALLTCLPAGTVSGKPKEKAMAFIDQLEEVPREIYGGAIGYIGFNGNIDFALTIRTMVIHDGKAFVQAGAGIVEQSQATEEFMETEHKARSFIHIIGKK